MLHPWKRYYVWWFVPKSKSSLSITLWKGEPFLQLCLLKDWLGPERPQNPATDQEKWSATWIWWIPLSLSKIILLSVLLIYPALLKTLIYELYIVSLLPFPLFHLLTLPLSLRHSWISPRFKNTLPWSSLAPLFL